jgi:type I restriction enzyme S subunit
MEEQKKLAELLWAANDLKEKYKKAITATDEMLKAKFREMFGDTAGNSKNWPMPKFGDSLNGIENGKSFVCQTVSREGDYPAVLKLSSVTYGVYQSNENKAVLDESQYNPKMEVRTGDLLMTRKNTLELVGACAYVHETTPRLMLPDIVFRLDVKDCYDKQFLWALLSHPDQRHRIQRIAGGTNTSMVNISKERLCNLPMVVPPLALQREFVAIAEKAEAAKTALKKSIADIDQVMKGLING